MSTYEAMSAAFNNHYNLDHWLGLYRTFGIQVNYEHITVPEKPEGDYIPVLNAVEMSMNDTNKHFKRMLCWYGIVCFIAPGSRAGKPYTFSSITGPNIRSAENDGSYVFWAKNYIRKPKRGPLKRIDNRYSGFDTRMTVEEAMLFHLFQIRRYGRVYIDLHYSDNNHCTGSSGRNNLRWDIQDIKICLD